MKYNNKKLLTLLLVAAMVVMLLPTTALADANVCGDFEYITTGDSSCVITGYLGSSLDVIIPDELDGYTVTDINMDAFKDDGLTSVVIPDTVRTIDSSAFYGNKLSSVALPSSLEYIGVNAFSENTVDSVTMTEITLPQPKEGYISTWTDADSNEFSAGDNVPVSGVYYNNLQRIFDYWLMDKDLKIVAICGYNGEETDVVIPEAIDGYIVNEITFDAFRNKGITSVTLPDSIMILDNNVFADNPGLASITLPASYKGYVNTYIDGSGNEYAAGSGITDFTKKYIAKVGFVETSEGKAVITNYTPDTSVCVIPSKISDLTVWGVYVEACVSKGITELTLPNTITHIGEAAFADNELTSVTLPSSVKIIGRYAFEANVNLQSFDLPEAPAGYTSYWNEYERSYEEVCSVESESEEMSPLTTRPPETINEVNGGYTVTNFRNFYEWVKNVPNEYTVTFKDSDGTVIKTVTQDYGTELEYPSDPAKDGYEFNGWSSDLETVPAQDLTITATYISNEAPRGNITGTLVDSDGNPIVGKVVKLHSKVVTTVTDSKGRFVFTNVPLVDHELIIESTDGSELGRYDLAFGESSSTSYSVDETDVDVNVTSSTVAIDILVNVSEEGEVSIEEITFQENPQTGDKSSSMWTLWAVVAAMIIAGAVIITKRRAITNN